MKNPLEAIKDFFADSGAQLDETTEAFLNNFGRMPPHYSEDPICRFCNSTEFYEGPSAGLSSNIECAKCGAKFIYTPFGVKDLAPPTGVKNA